MLPINKLTNERGLTLIEVLAIVVLSSLILIFSGTLIVQAMKNYETTTAEIALRDEADILMTTLMKELFSLKVSEVNETNCLIMNTTICPLTLVDPQQQITFLAGNEIVANGNSYTIQHKYITVKNSKILYNKEFHSVHVEFTLKHTSKDIETTFKNEILLIKDTM